VLFKCINILSSGFFCHEAIVVDGINIPLLRDHVSKTTAGRVFERNAPGLVAEDALNIIAVIELVIEARRNFNLAGWVTILNYDDVVRLKKGAPGNREKQRQRG